MKRQDILQFCTIKNPIGVELGVAEGIFSEMMLSSYPIKHLYSIDRWAGDRNHGKEQHERAMKRLLPYKDRNTVLKMTFSEAVSQFPDEYFDFIYIDGYAHTGQEDGKTLEEWWPKLKYGGLFSGDDYHPKWPKTQEAVNNFATNKGISVNVYEFDNTENNPWCRFPSWYMIK